MRVQQCNFNNLQSTSICRLSSRNQSKDNNLNATTNVSFMASDKNKALAVIGNFVMKHPNLALTGRVVFGGVSIGTILFALASLAGMTE